ncbi:unnamed protein product [Penicillium pancosmium]
MVRFVTDSRARPTKKSPLLVIGAGLPRTATSSLQAALEELGFDPCLHMAQIIPHPDRMETLIEAAKEKDNQRRQKLIRQLVDGYETVCDMPAVFFLPELLEMYPKAKIVLSTRPDAVSDRLWYRMNMHILDWCKEKYGSNDPFNETMYARHNDMVRTIAKERGHEVLEFEAEDGWKPLCEFLDKAIPDSRFPKLNEKRTFRIIKAILIAKGLLGWSAVGGVAWLGWKFIRSFF